MRLRQTTPVIEVVAPGSKCPRSEFLGALQFLRENGYSPHYTPGLMRSDFLFAQSDDWRLRDLLRALKAKNSAAVWCVRGGYGSQRLLPGLSRSRRLKQDRLFLGLSDITVLHLFLVQKWGWKTLHAPVLSRIGGGRSPKVEQSELLKILSGEVIATRFRRLTPLNDAACKQKQIRSSIIGGNLCMLAQSLGTSWQIVGRKKIIFLEEVNERAYQIDRNLNHLMQAGVFEKASAVVFGDIVGGENKLISKTLRRFANELPIPVLKGVPSGHGRLQRVVPLGTQTTLTTGHHAEMISSLSEMRF